MSGVRTGTRLERLEQLERLLTQVQQEIASERRRLALDDHPTTKKPATTTRRASDQSTQDRLDDLGVTSKDVKTWAVGAGLLPAVKQGRVGRWLIEAYAQAHP